LNGIAISGKAGSGKTTLAGYVVDELKARGIPAYRCAFGDELKRQVRELYGVEKNDPNGRVLLIGHGEAQRDSDPLYWIRALATHIDAREGGFPVIDDLRFPTELAWALGKSFLTVRLEARADVRLSRLTAAGKETAIVDSHSFTETALDRCHDDFDLVLENNLYRRSRRLQSWDRRALRLDRGLVPHVRLVTKKGVPTWDTPCYRFSRGLPPVAPISRPGSRGVTGGDYFSRLSSNVRRTTDAGRVIAAAAPFVSSRRTYRVDQGTVETTIHVTPSKVTSLPSRSSFTRATPAAIRSRSARAASVRDLYVKSPSRLSSRDAPLLVGVVTADAADRAGRVAHVRHVPAAVPPRLVGELDSS
jgi:hypothetical protein